MTLGSATLVAHTYSDILLHIVFSTKNHEPFLSPEFAPKIHAYMAGIVRAKGGAAHIINGHREHVHLLVSPPPKLSVPDLLQQIKGSSSHWAKEHVRLFGWQAGYGVFSVSRSNFDQVYAYIANQEEHHKRDPFGEEWRALLDRHGSRLRRKPVKVGIRENISEGNPEGKTSVHERLAPEWAPQS